MFTYPDGSERPAGQLLRCGDCGQIYLATKDAGIVVPRVAASDQFAAARRRGVNLAAAEQKAQPREHVPGGGNAATAADPLKWQRGVGGP